MWTLEDLSTEAKKNPGKLTCGKSGTHVIPRFALELSKIETCTKIALLPMEGSGPAVTAVLGGHISFTSTELGVVHKYLEAGSLRALAIWATKCDKDFPNGPTTVERRFPELILPIWQSFNVWQKPREIVQKKWIKLLNNY